MPVAERAIALPEDFFVLEGVDLSRRGTDAPKAAISG